MQTTHSSWRESVGEGAEAGLGSVGTGVNKALSTALEDGALVWRAQGLAGCWGELLVPCVPAGVVEVTQLLVFKG